MKLIVVGNGAISEPQGHLIDRFDTVVRLSGFKIKGYEAAVGSKTHVHSIGRVEEVAPDVKVWAANPAGIADAPKTVREQLLPQGFIVNERVEEAAGLMCLPDGIAPSLGALTIIMAVEHGKFFYDLPITITGFDFSHPGWPHYYWTGGVHNGITPGHDSKQERLFVKSLIEKGYVQYLIPQDVACLEDAYYNPKKWVIQNHEYHPVVENYPPGMWVKPEKKESEEK